MNLVILGKGYQYSCLLLAFGCLKSQFALKKFFDFPGWLRALRGSFCNDKINHAFDGEKSHSQFKRMTFHFINIR